MFFSPSSTQSARSFILISSSPDFDVLSTQQRVMVTTNFTVLLSGNVSVNVFNSDAVFWWAAIFRPSLIDVRQNTASVKVQGAL